MLLVAVRSLARHRVAVIGRTIEGHTATIALAGDVGDDDVDRLRRAWVDAVEGGAKSIAVDLAEVTFLSTAALQSFMHAMNLTAERGGSLVLHNPSPRLRRVLEVAEHPFPVEP